MPGARPRGFYFGDSAELLAEFILGSMAFVTRVPRQEDVGYDLLCVMKERAGTDMFRAGAFFTVQVKSRREPLVFGKDKKWWEVSWIKDQQNPFFVCVVDRETKTIELYSTWNMLNGFLLRSAHRIVLVPGERDAPYAHPRSEEAVPFDPNGAAEQTIPLGKPVLRMTVDDAIDLANAERLGGVLREWIELDLRNITNRKAAMYWIEGPDAYETNASVRDGPRIQTVLWNAKNLPDAVRNFCRSATALRLVLRHALGPTGEHQFHAKISALELVLRAHAGDLEPTAARALAEQVGLLIDRSPGS